MLISQAQAVFAGDNSGIDVKLTLDWFVLDSVFNINLALKNKFLWRSGWRTRNNSKRELPTNEKKELSTEEQQSLMNELIHFCSSSKDVVWKNKKQ
jgi:hypothetical protein